MSATRTIYPNETGETMDIQAALLAMHGKVVRFRGTKYKVDCRSTTDTLGIDRFHLYAENLEPKTREESLYCLWDLWASETENGMAFVAKLARLGGFAA